MPFGAKTDFNPSVVGVGGVLNLSGLLAVFERDEFKAFAGVEVVADEPLDIEGFSGLQDHGSVGQGVGAVDGNRCQRPALGFVFQAKPVLRIKRQVCRAFAVFIVFSEGFSVVNDADNKARFLVGHHVSSPC